MSGDSSTAFEDGDIKTDAAGAASTTAGSGITPDYSDVANALPGHYLTRGRGVTSTVTSADAGLYPDLDGTEKGSPFWAFP